MQFSETDVQAVWNKGVVVSNNDPNVWRQDACGAWIRRDHYGSRESQYGWEVDHVKPLSAGGATVLSNLRPLHWANNASKQDGRLVLAATSQGVNNVRV